MIIVFQSAIDPHSSYFLHLFALMQGLFKMGHEPVIRAISVAVGTPSGVMQSVVQGIQSESVEILLAPLKGQVPTPGKRTIRMFSWESTRIPAGEVALLNQCAVCVVPSNFVATVASACGVNVPIVVVPLGADQKFHYWPPATQPFTFACAGNPMSGVQRKGLDRIMRLFQKAFPDEINVKLSVKTTRAAYPKRDWLDDTRIELQEDFTSDEDVEQWLADCHCFINFATGGWELWAHQAMRVGRPVLGCAYGGMADYFNTSNGFVVGHHLVPAGDSWAGNGLWAEPDEESAIGAMRYIYSISRELIEKAGTLAHLTVKDLTWENSCRRLAAVIEQLTPKTEPMTARSYSESDEFTVAITSFKRPGYLVRAINSAVAAGADHIAVSSMEPDDATAAVIHHYKEKLGSMMTVSIIPVDLGCNSLWLDAAYHSPTERLIILHDDDFLDPKFGGVYENVIRPALNSGAGFASWRAHCHWDGGRVKETEYFHGETRVLPSKQLEAIVATPGRLSLSPVISIFNRSVLIAALKECEQCLTHPDCLLRPGMLLGTEVMVYLRHCSTFKQWLYVDQVLSYYGAHDGSGTVQAERANDLAPLIAGYDRTRDYCVTHRYKPARPLARLILVYSPYEPRDADEARRMENAYHTWRFHFDQGAMLEFPASKLKRDAEGIPYVRDIIDYGMQFARPEDIVAYCNRDLCLTILAFERIAAGVNRGNGVTVAIRRNWPHPGKMLRRSALNCKPDGGFDLFAFTPEWWKRHRSQMPDMLIAREAWDTVLRVIAEESGAGDGVYVDDVCWHENHMSYWIERRTTDGGQIHNRKLGLEFFKRRTDARAGWIVRQLSM